MFDISDWFLENFRPPLESEEGEDVTHFLYVFKLIFGYLNDDISKYLDFVAHASLDGYLNSVCAVIKMYLWCI